MIDFYKTAAAIGISLSMVSVPIAIISTVSYFKLSEDFSKLSSTFDGCETKIPFSRSDMTRIDKDCIVGFMLAQPVEEGPAASDGVAAQGPTASDGSAADGSTSSDGVAAEGPAASDGSAVQGSTASDGSAAEGPTEGDGSAAQGSTEGGDRDAGDDCTPYPIECSSDFVIAIPPTNSLSRAAVSLYRFWEHTNPRVGRDVPTFFPVLASGVVKTDMLIGTRYKYEDLPAGSVPLFVDERLAYFRSYKNDFAIDQCPRQGFCVFIRTLNNDDVQQKLRVATWIRRLCKKGQEEADCWWVYHDRGRPVRFTLNDFYGNIDSSDEIDYYKYFSLR